jgi:hypothetical protein
LFAIFEDAVKYALIQSGVISADDGLREPDVMKKVKDKLQRDGTFPQFRDRLANRAMVQNFTDAEAIWKFFTECRHLYVHSGGRATEKWLKKFRQSQNDLMKQLTKETDFAKMFVADIIEACQPRTSQLFVVTDKFTNVFRNFIVSIMEALYLTESRRRPASNTGSSGP